MAELFGTDGVRGIAGEDLTEGLAFSLGRAAGEVLMDGKGTLVVGRDTRQSGPWLASALVAGAKLAGVDALSAGIVPTPAVAYLTAHLGASAGVVISASHNPYQDNGIKFFGPDGSKLSVEQEKAIEEAMEDPPDVDFEGSAERITDAEDVYIEHCLACLSGLRLEGLRVAVDCAHGASFHTSPRALEQAGADVIVLNAEPDGTNINAGCGSNHPEVVARAVLEHGADLGLAHDGDADRLIAADERGEIVDGDATIAALALDMKAQGRLKGDKVVVTVMANLGFRKQMQAAGVDVIETDVGDRHVVEAMRINDAVIGGEQSGHVILSEYATTGDGLITGLRLGALLQDGRPLSEIASLERFPQVLKNVKVSDRSRLEDHPEVGRAVEEARDRLGDSGRILVRPSGTEPVVRVMVEAADEDTARMEAERLAELISQKV